MMMATHNPPTNPRKMFRWTLLALTLCVAMFAACEDNTEDDTNTDADACGGTVIEHETISYCVYEGEVIVEEGFRCPDAFGSLHQRGDLGICSPNVQEPEEALVEIELRYRETRIEDPAQEPDGRVDPETNKPVGIDGLGLSCATKNDCALVYEGNVCGCGCEEAALANSSLDAFNERVTDLRDQCEEVLNCGPCEIDMWARCVENQCVAEPLEGLSPLGFICDNPVEISISVEPLEPDEEFIVLFRDGIDVAATVALMAEFYDIEVIDVFDIIPAFSANMGGEIANAIACYPGVQSIVQSRTNTPPPGTETPLSVSSLGTECVDETGNTTAEELEVTSLGAGAVGVRHVVNLFDCCAEPAVTASYDPDSDEQLISIEVTNTANMECDCTCIFELNYTLGSVPEGEWTFQAGALSQTITVDNE